ncbi:MAG: AAA family ATPase [Planctomycetaceae bacterium]
MHFHLHHDYIDRANRHHPADEFSRWVTPENGPSVPNAGGIRGQRVSGGGGELAVVYLMTAHAQTVSANPWTDHVDVASGTIEYWGDARSGSVREPRGNKLLRQIAALPPAQRPPILHFTRTRPGVLRFGGLCVLEELHEREFTDGTGEAIPNLLVKLAILDAEIVETSWLRRRVEEGSVADKGADCPAAWQQAIQGRVMRLQRRDVRENKSAPPVQENRTFDAATQFEELLQRIQWKGFQFEPWQIAAYITALRTKPFVILAGVSGTGKSKLPALVAELTGMEETVRIAVRPDWNDSSEVLGHVDLQGRFRPGVILQKLHDAGLRSNHFHTCLVDEMNLAPVEYYFAEMLSAMEDIQRLPTGGYWSTPVTGNMLEHDDDWARVCLPPNFALVGTVNVDETTHSFSRKVLDRAFTIELSEIDLSRVSRRRNGRVPEEPARISPWPISFWLAGQRRLADILQPGLPIPGEISAAIEILALINRVLTRAQLQVGYRVRDEVGLFLYNARELMNGFRTLTGSAVDPLDLAVCMKVLPRITGGSQSIRWVLGALAAIAQHGTLAEVSGEPDDVLQSRFSDFLPGDAAPARFPMLLARLSTMYQRLEREGFTSFWN